MRTKRWSAMALAVLLGVLAVPTQALAAQWTQGNPLIAHALGEVDGKIETNSKEAFIASWENGYRVLEADFVYTSDGALVVRHDFDVDGSYYRLEIEPGSPLVMDSKTFQNEKIIYEQTPMTAADLMYLMTQYTDVYLVTDTKDTEEQTVKKQFTDLKAIANNIGHPEILDRLIPQIYHEEMLVWIQEIYDFPQWIYTLYQQNDVDYAAVADFCAHNGIDVVTIEKERITAEIVDLFRTKGITVYAHTVNRYLQMEELLEMGVSGVYTDRIKPYELDWVGLEPMRQKHTRAVKMGNGLYTIQTIDVMGTEYARLRDVAQMLSENGGFSAKYDPQTKTLALQNSSTFTTLGNELLLTDSDRCITKQADTLLTYNGAEITMEGYTVDGDLFYPLQGILDMTGCVMTESEQGAVISKQAAETAN